ncbi:MAG: TetR/AcrR family transcriptional regulator [Rubrivivax sp.]
MATRRASRPAAPPAVPPQPAGARSARRLQRAAEIVATARDAFRVQGYQATSVAQIAARVGVVEGLVYAYYPTKRHLLDEVLRAMYAPLLRDLEEGFARVRGLRSRLHFLIVRHLRVYVEEPQLARLVLHEVRLGPDYAASVLHELHVRYTGYVDRALHDAVAAGELDADTDVELVRCLVYGGIEHRMWAVLFGRATVDVQALAERLTSMVMRAIGAGTAAPSDGVEARLARLEQLLAGTAPAVAPARPSRGARTAAAPAPAARRR